MTNSSPISQPSKTLKGCLHRQKAPLLQRPKTASTLKVGSIAEQLPLLLQNDLTAGQVHLIPVRKINMIIFGEILKSSSVSKISTSLYRSESKKRECHIIADSEPSSLMHPISPSSRTYWNVNFSRISRFRPLTATLFKATWSSM